jgi:aspartate ammonia-lyase
MKTSQVSTKFLIVFELVGVLTLGTTTFAAWKMSKINNEIKGLSSGPTRAALEVNRAGRVLVKAQASIADVLLAPAAADAQ